MYPREDVAARVEGQVVLQVTVARTGRVSDVKAISGPSPSLAEATRLAVLQWRYEPWMGSSPESRTFTLRMNMHLPNNFIDLVAEQRKGGLPADPGSGTAGICVRVTDNDVRPVVGAQVELRTPSAGQSGEVTSSSGTACNIAIPPGEYALIVTSGRSRVEARVLVKPAINSWFEVGLSSTPYVVWTSDSSAANRTVTVRASLWDCKVTGTSYECPDVTTPSAPPSPGRSAVAQRSASANAGVGAANPGPATASGSSAAKLPPLQLEDTVWFCTANTGEGREFEGFMHLRRDGNAKMAESNRRGPRDWNGIIWPKLDPNWNGPDEIARLRSPTLPGYEGNRWASTSDEARVLFTTTVNHLYRFRAKGGQLIGTMHGFAEGWGERYVQNPTSTPVWNVGFKDPFGSISCERARAWLQR